MQTTVHYPRHHSYGHKSTSLVLLSVEKQLLTIKQINRLQRCRIRALHVRPAGQMLNVHPTHLVPNPQHTGEPTNRRPMGCLRVRTNGTRPFRPEAPVEHSMVHNEELFIRQVKSRPRILPASQRRIRRDRRDAVRPSPPVPQHKLTLPRATFLLNLLLGIWSLIPTASQRAANKIGLDDMQTKHSPLSDNSDREWEMKRVLPTHATPATPYTPRTLAFNTLDRQLPLRAQGGFDKGRWN